MINDVLNDETQTVNTNNDLELELSNTVPPKDIFAFNELRSCADLKRMYDKKQLDLSPAFQREQVWQNAAQTRFLDSLLKNLPIPSMCFSQDTETGKRIVIDGLQRISTIVKFLDAAENQAVQFQLSVLEDVDERLSGQDVYQIAQNHPEIIEQIENVTIPVTALRSNFNNTEHMEYIFTIFHRLNTGGTRLNAQEIRNCIFSGNFNDLLFKCAEKFNMELNLLLGIKENKRFAHEEFILRFYALDENLENYSSQLTRFLNLYMKDKRNLLNSELQDKETRFTATLNIFKQHLIDEKIGAKIIAEAVLYGIAQNLDKLNQTDTHSVKQAFENMKKMPAFDEKELREGTSNATKVKARLEAAKQAFSG